MKAAKQFVGLVVEYVSVVASGFSVVSSILGDGQEPAGIFLPVIAASENSLMVMDEDNVQRMLRTPVIYS